MINYKSSSNRTSIFWKRDINGIDNEKLCDECNQLPVRHMNLLKIFIFFSID